MTERKSCAQKQILDSGSPIGKFALRGAFANHRPEKSIQPPRQGGWDPLTWVVPHHPLTHHTIYGTGYTRPPRARVPTHILATDSKIIFFH